MLKLPIVPPLETAEDASDRRTTVEPASGDRRDLEDGDLRELMVAFYDTIMRDALLAPYFATLDMPAHMPRIEAFWSTIVFRTGRYSGNVFVPHLAMPGLTAGHFRRWLSTLEQIVDARFSGEATERMKALAHRIAFNMQLRLGISPDPEPRSGS